MLKDLLCDDFQEKVSEVLIRHKSILDIVTKLGESNARINRAVVKASTSCGCITINAQKQTYDKETLAEVKDSLKTHLDGDLCEVCKEKVEEELGDYLFYMASLCNALNLNLYDILIKEYKELDTLGIYSLL